jgi:hypothetical protein
MRGEFGSGSSSNLLKGCYHALQDVDVDVGYGV